MRDTIFSLRDTMSATPKTPRTTEKFDQHTCRKALALVGMRQAEWADSSLSGLSIRIRKESATWCLRGRLLGVQTIRAIGPVDRVTVTEARERARAAKDLLKRGVDPAPMLAVALLGGPIVRTGDVNVDGLTWIEGRDAFLEHIKKERAPRTYRDYYDTLVAVETRDFAAWDDKLLKHITKNDVRKIQEDIFERSKSQAHHKLRVVKSCFSWLAARSMARPIMVARPMASCLPLKRMEAATRF